MATRCLVVDHCDAAGRGPGTGERAQIGPGNRVAVSGRSGADRILEGLGFLLIDSQNTGRTDVMLLAIVLLAVLGKLSDTALGAVERRMVRRRS